MKFVDLGMQFAAYEAEIRTEMDKVLRSESFINGSAIAELEASLSNFCGAPFAITCSSGSDAILLGLMAKDVRPGDEIIVPAFTFIATASMVSLYRARPVFVDVNPQTFNLDPDEIAQSITSRTVGIIPVSLYGQCADMEAINSIAAEYGLWVMEDAAQSFGASTNGSMSCNLSELATTSFFPAKPLGCFGDGGAVFTNNKELAEKLKLLRNHGQKQRYSHKLIGINGRMDTLQAAILKVKLSYFIKELDMRQAAAERYNTLLADYVELPVLQEGNTSTWAQYTIRVSDRDNVQCRLDEAGIPSAVHYPLPLGQQAAFANLPKGMPTPVSEGLAKSVLSLPMHAFISKQNQIKVARELKRILND